MNTQFIFPTSISYHFYKGFVGNVFWEALLHQRAVAKRRDFVRISFSFSGDRFLFPHLSLSLSLSFRKGLTIRTLSYAFLRLARKQIFRSKIRITLNEKAELDWKNHWKKQKRQIEACMIVYLFLITPDRIYTYIHEIPMCTLAFVLSFLS